VISPEESAQRRKDNLKRKCLDFRQMIGWEGLWNNYNLHQFDCKECYKWWINQVMIEAFKKNQNNHNKRISI